MKRFFESGRSLWRNICRAHRSDDATGHGVFVDFFLPRPTRGFFLRLTAVTLLSWGVFGWLLIPCVIDGESMMPTFPSHGCTLNWRGKFFFRRPHRGEVVIIRYADKVYYLKRVVALPGETVEFRQGQLWVDGIRLEEPYVKFLCDWNLPPRKVLPGHCYVVGDNRSQPIQEHKFGQVLIRRIDGAPLW